MSDNQATTDAHHCVRCRAVLVSTDEDEARAPAEADGASRARAGGNVALRTLRLSRHWTQADLCAAFETRSRELGKALSLSARQLRRWESDNPPCPLPAYQRVLESLFGVPITELGFRPSWAVPWPPGGHGNPERRHQPYEECEPVKRREFMSGTAAIGIATLLPGQVVHRLPRQGVAASQPAHLVSALGGPEMVSTRMPTVSVADRDTLASYAAITREQRRLYWSLPAPRMFTATAVHAQLGAELLHSQPPWARTEVAPAVAETSMLAARLAFFDLQQPETARHLYRGALTAARQADDHQLGAAVLAHLAFIPAFAGDPAEARDLVRGAHAHAARGVSALQRSWLYAVESEVEARLGNSRRAMDLIRRSEDALLSDGYVEPPPWLDFYDAARLRGFRGFIELTHGDIESARDDLEETLAALPSHAVKQRSIVFADLAQSHLRERDVDATCDALQRSLDVLQNHWYATAMERVRSVRERLTPFRESRATRRLDEAISHWQESYEVMA